MDMCLKQLFAKLNGLQMLFWSLADHHGVEAKSKRREAEKLLLTHLDLQTCCQIKLSVEHFNQHDTRSRANDYYALKYNSQQQGLSFTLRAARVRAYAVKHHRAPEPPG